MAFELRLVGDMPELTAAVTRAAVALERLVRILRKPPRPGIFKFRADRRRDGMLQFVITGIPGLNPETDFDVVRRELEVVIGDQPAVVLELPAEAIPELANEQFAGAQDARVSLKLCNVDDAGNRSEPRVLEVVLVDTVAPATPGEFGVRITSELPDVPPPAPEPEPEPEPAPEPEPEV